MPLSASPSPLWLKKNNQIGGCCWWNLEHAQRDGGIQVGPGPKNILLPGTKHLSPLPLRLQVPKAHNHLFPFQAVNSQSQQIGATDQCFSSNIPATYQDSLVGRQMGSVGALLLPQPHPGSDSACTLQAVKLLLGGQLRVPGPNVSYTQHRPVEIME